MRPELPFAEELTLPVICAPMFLVSGPDLVISALRAGIVGAMSAGTFRTTHDLEVALETVTQAREELGAACPPYALNLSLNAKRRLGPERFAADCAVCARYRVPLVITTSGNPAEIVAMAHDWGSMVFHDVTTIAHARKAVEAGVDGLILVCVGGGGHSGLLNPFAFLPAVRRFFHGPIVLAGAIANGAAILAAQALGADLCYIGTRFIASRESMAPRAYKQMLITAGVQDLTYTGAFTRAAPANFLNESIRAAGFDPERLEIVSNDGDGPRAWRDIWSAGQSVALIDDIVPVAEIVARLRDDYDSARRRLLGQ